MLEPRTQAFIDALSARGATPIHELSYGEARKFLEDTQAGASTLPADVADKVLPIGPTGEVPVRIYRPKGTQGPLPVVMYFHGGGWVLGGTHTHDRLLRDLVNGTHAAFVFVSYTPSPEAQFPVPVEQVYAATAFIAVTRRCAGAFIRNSSFDISSSFDGIVASASISLIEITRPSTTPILKVNSGVSLAYLVNALAIATGSPVV